MHTEPRLIRVTEADITHQLVRNGMLDHELGSILVRRQNQLDRESSSDTPYLNHRHILECDFSTLALSNASISTLLEVQNQFIGSTDQHAIEACQLVISILLSVVKCICWTPPDPWSLTAKFSSSIYQPSFEMAGPCTYGTCLPGLSRSSTLQRDQKDAPKISRRATSSSRPAYTTHCSGA